MEGTVSFQYEPNHIYGPEPDKAIPGLDLLIVRFPVIVPPFQLLPPEILPFVKLNVPPEKDAFIIALPLPDMLTDVTSPDGLLLISLHE